MDRTREHTSFLSNPRGRVVTWVAWDELPCKYCGRQAGERCKDWHGIARKPHAVRLKAARTATAAFRDTGGRAVNSSAGETASPMFPKLFYLQHGHGTAGPFRTEAVPAIEEGKPQRRRGSVTATRFKVTWYGRKYRVYSDHASRDAYPHFILSQGERIAVSGVSP